MDLFRLDGKVAVLTGGSGQLGQEYIRVLTGYGAKVAVFDVLSSGSDNANAKYYAVDITKREVVEDALNQVIVDFGSPEILINNAAIDSPPSAPASENGMFEKYPLESLERILDVNIKGTFICCQVVGGEMAKGLTGSIINIASTYGLVSPVQDIYEYKRKNGDEWYKPAPYAVSKSAILNLTRYLATYWAKKGVSVNTLTPAGIFNNQDVEFLEAYVKRIPIGRMARSDEMNGAIIFLASDASSYMTGANLIVDGGWTAW